MPKLENRNTKLESPAERSLPRVRDFTDLQVWQLARELRKTVYLQVRGFPADEKYALGQQMRRALTSITANIYGGIWAVFIRSTQARRKASATVKP